MIQAGLIVGVITVVFILGFTLISPFCTPCVAIFMGLGAGFLAGVFDKPLDNSGSAKSGAAAGAIGGVGAIIGQMIGTAVNGLMVGSEGAADIVQQLGLPVDSAAGFDMGYWGGLIGSACCFGLLAIALMAGTGALGGLLWWATVGKKSTPAGA
ncbi:MAG: hypothetical protein JXM69_13175 [Anaerolineae bacterium]|nr:hypothetical protein [Anaerolineae bacterium]